MSLFQRSSSSTAPTPARTQSAAQDPTQTLKRRARQRLIGVITLVVTAIIVLPMILDSEPRPLNDDLSIVIPSKDSPPSGKSVSSAPAPVAEVTTTQDDIQVTPPPAASTAVKSVVDKPVGKVVDKPVDSAVNKTIEKDTEKRTDISPAMVPAKPVDKPVDKSVPKPLDKVVDKPVDKHAADRAQAMLDGKADQVEKSTTHAEKKPESKPEGKERFWVQIGAFANAQKVEELNAKLLKAGLKPQLAVLETKEGPRTRVRLGVFTSKAEAEKAQDKLKALGLSGTLMADPSAK